MTPIFAGCAAISDHFLAIEQNHGLLDPAPESEVDEYYLHEQVDSAIYHRRSPDRGFSRC
jgi:hypothetical protein